MLFQLQNYSGKFQLFKWFKFLNCSMKFLKIKQVKILEICTWILCEWENVKWNQKHSSLMISFCILNFCMDWMDLLNTNNFISFHFIFLLMANRQWLLKVKFIPFYMWTKIILFWPQMFHWNDMSEFTSSFKVDFCLSQIVNAWFICGFVLYRMMTHYF